MTVSALATFVVVHVLCGRAVRVRYDAATRRTHIFDYVSPDDDSNQLVGYVESAYLRPHERRIFINGCAKDIDHTRLLRNLRTIADIDFNVYTSGLEVIVTCKQ